MGNGLTYVVNRNLDPSAVAGADQRSRQRLAALVAEASELGATEICMQGPLPPDSDDDYLDLIAAVKASGPEIHLHAFRPAGTARRRGPARDAAGGVPAAAGRRGSARSPAPPRASSTTTCGRRLAGGPDLPVSRWVEVIEAAHQAGLPSTATMVFGHIETPAHQVAHLRTLAGIQDRTGGFTEFIAMPFVPAAAPTSAGLPAPAFAGLPAPTPAPGLVGADVPGPSWRQVLAVHAVARLMLHERIGNIQAAWPKFGLDASVDLLRSGANDLGGLLLDGRLAPDAGAEAGLVLTLDDVERVARELGRPVWQRTTGYGKVVAGV